jgi:hypothetical protein
MAIKLLNLIANLKGNFRPAEEKTAKRRADSLGKSFVVNELNPYPAVRFFAIRRRLPGLARAV